MVARALSARRRLRVSRVSKSVTSRQRTPAGVWCVLSIRVIRVKPSCRADNITPDDFSRQYERREVVAEKRDCELQERVVARREYHVRF